MALLAPAFAVAAAGDAGPADGDGGAVAGARLAWFSGDELDLVGDAWADVPFGPGPRAPLFVALDLRTTIEDTTTDLDFVLRDLEYRAEAGFRLDAGAAGILSIFAGQRGKALVDDDGDAWVRYVAAGLQSRRFRSGPRRAGWNVAWRAALGPVLRDREVEADAWGAGALRVDWRAADARDPGRPAGAGIGLEVRVEALADGGSFEADVIAGPHVSLPAGGGRFATLFARYQRSRNPLGLGIDGWLVGLEYYEDASAPVEGGTGPDIYGTVALGAGPDERLAATLRLRGLTPVFAGAWRGAGVLETNALGGKALDELYYRYHVGIERLFPRGVAGVYFYHRSNHVLAGPGPGITSINVLEAGWETAEWHRAGRRLEPGGRLGAVDWRARGGWLVESAFGEERNWHVRAGARWTLPLAVARTQLYLRAEAEEGDVATHGAAFGAALTDRLEVEIEVRRDEQHYGDDEATLAGLRYGF